MQPAFDITASAARSLAAPLWRPLPVHRPCVVWFTGLSGAGKSTIADRLQVLLDDQGCRTARLDGDDVRDGLCSGLGFSPADRTENIRRVAHAAALMARSRLIVLVSLISPFQAARDHARSVVPADQFLEVFVDAPLDVVRQRDTKGLYARADRGEALQLTGVQSAYERPARPDLQLRTDLAPAEHQCARVIDRLVSHGVLDARTWR